MMPFSPPPVKSPDDFRLFESPAALSVGGGAARPSMNTSPQAQIPSLSSLFSRIWLLLALLTALIPTVHADSFTLVVKNGGMTQAGAAGAPAEWGGKSGDVETARDTDVYKASPASFRVSAAAGKSGQGFQTIAGGAGATFTLDGWFKTVGNPKAQVFVQAFSEGYKQNQFIQVQYQQGESDWTEFKKQITLPTWTAFFTVGVLIDGDGKAYLDEVHEVSAPVNGGQALTEEQLLTSGPPAKDKPDVPGWGFYPPFPSAWHSMHQGYLARAKQGNIPILFLGDSITQGWTDPKGGLSVWDKHYGPLGAVNFGIGGDSTRQVLWRITHGEIDGQHPKLIVLKIGTNNLYSDFNAGTDEEIAAGITKTVQTLRAALPQTKLLLLAVLPRQNDYFSGRIVTINKIIAKLDNGKAVRFLDMGPQFATSLGKVKPELFHDDQLHVDTAGYQVWADTMQPLFDTMLKTPLTSPLTPAPIKPNSGGAGKRKVKPSAILSGSPPINGGGGRGAMGLSHSPEHWQALAMERPDLLAAGIKPGGEGCQYPQTITIDGLHGQFLLYGTDVGGIFRSVDGGKTFSACDMGYSAIGSCGFAIDPKNPTRCLSVGDNSGQDGNVYYQYDGVYLSTDQGASWKQVLPKLNRGSEKAREQIAFDPSSYNPKLSYCMVAYWAEEGNQLEPGGRLYKTTDGGVTWAQIADGAAYGGGHLSSLLKIHPTTGAVYIANDNGFYQSTDGGATFTRKQSGDFTSLDVAPSRPNAVFLATENTILVSWNAGKTFTTIPHKGVKAFYRVKVSPADPRRMLCQNPQDNGERYFSSDGGKTWVRSGKNMAQSWIPPDILYNDRARLVVWHPTNPDLAWGIGPGDIITRTVDAGKTFVWGNNGNNGIMTGGLFNFNTQNPNVLYFGSQDYNGALTTNSGKTWTFINLSKDNKHSSRPGGDDGDPWGWVYGGYAASPLILYGGNRALTEQNYNLWITFDGGKTTMEKVKNLAGAQVSYGDPTDPKVLFCWNQRSADDGQTWAAMVGCDGVFTSSPIGKHDLYGCAGKAIVRSNDHGITWRVLSTLPADIRDLGYDQAHDRIYAAAGDNSLYECDGPAYAPVNLHDRLPRDQHGDGFMTSTVAVDPVDPNVVYAGANGTGLFFQRSAGVARSTDGGLTWERLTQNPAYCLNGVTGGEMASAMRVHPITRELFVGTDCYGTWKIGPPTKIGPPAGSKRQAKVNK
jgi:lysophospholipase L1-like esterase